MDITTEHATELPAMPHAFKGDAGKCPTCGHPESFLLHQAFERQQLAAREQAGRSEIPREFGVQK